MDVVVIGAGAIGGYFGALLAKGGHIVTVVERGTPFEAIRAHGLEIKGGPDECRVRVAVRADLSEVRHADLALVAVKSYDTDSACGGLAPVLGDGGCVLTLQNGVDRAEAIERIVGSGRVLVGAVYMEAAVESPGVIRYLSGARRIVFGEPHGAVSPRVVNVQRALRQAGINAEASDDMPRELWHKYVLVCAANGLTALTRSPFGQIIHFPPGWQLVSELMREATAVSSALGIELGADFVDEALVFLNGMGPQLKSSMLRDLELGRQTEVDTLNGLIVRRAEELGISTPINRVVWVSLMLHNLRVAESAVSQ